MTMIRKRLMIRAANIYAANVIRNAMGCGVTSDFFMNSDEEKYFQEYINIIADKISLIEVPKLDDCFKIAKKQVNEKVQ